MLWKAVALVVNPFVSLFHVLNNIVANVVHIMHPNLYNLIGKQTMGSQLCHQDLRMTRPTPPKSRKGTTTRAGNWKTSLRYYVRPVPRHKHKHPVCEGAKVCQQRTKWCPEKVEEVLQCHSTTVNTDNIPLQPYGLTHIPSVLTAMHPNA